MESIILPRNIAQLNSKLPKKTEMQRSSSVNNSMSYNNNSKLQLSKYDIELDALLKEIRRKRENIGQEIVEKKKY